VLRWEAPNDNEVFDENFRTKDQEGNDDDQVSGGFGSVVGDAI